MSEISMNLQEQIAFCEEKSRNIKLKTEPQTFVNIKANLEKLEKIEKVLNSCNDVNQNECDAYMGNCFHCKYERIEQIVKG